MVSLRRRCRISSRQRRPGCAITSAPLRSRPATGSRRSAKGPRRTMTITTRSWHKRLREEWGYGREENLTTEQIIEEQYRGIRPAAGYPACPDHTEKGILWKLLDVEQTAGIKITESFAMWPASSVSGLYFAHPEAKYFGVGKIDRDQVLDYHLRKQMDLQAVERWLSPNLNYDPDAPGGAITTAPSSIACSCGVPHPVIGV